MIEILLRRHQPWQVVAETAEIGAMLAGRRGQHVHFLDIIGNNNAGDRPFGDGDAYRAINQVADLGRMRRHMHIIMGHILIQRNQIDFLLIIGAQGHGRLLADDGQHRHMILFRVIESVEQMDRSRSGGGQADADLAGEFGVGTGLKTRPALHGGPE